MTWRDTFALFTANSSSSVKLRATRWMPISAFTFSSRTGITVAGIGW